MHEVSFVGKKKNKKCPGDYENVKDQGYVTDLGYLHCVAMCYIHYYGIRG